MYPLLWVPYTIVEISFWIWTRWSLLRCKMKLLVAEWKLSVNRNTTFKVSSNHAWFQVFPCFHPFLKGFNVLSYICDGCTLLFWFPFGWFGRHFLRNAQKSVGKIFVVCCKNFKIGSSEMLHENFLLRLHMSANTWNTHYKKGSRKLGHNLDRIYLLVQTGRWICTITANM